MPLTKPFRTVAEAQMGPNSLSWILTAPLVALLAACGGGGSSSEGSKGEDEVVETPGPDLASYDTTIPTVEYRWDPQAGDASVSAEDGGPGFTGEGWETKMSFEAMGVAGVPQGGEMHLSRPDWPPTLRMAGKDWNTDIAYQIRDLCYESLLFFHPNTLEYVPYLATHWQISEDKMTYRFRLNPEARFSNGEEVTAEDVVASYDLRMDESILEPSSQVTFGKMHRPEAISKYIVEVRCKEENWRNFLYFSGVALTIFPKSEIGGLTGTEYLDQYQFKLCSGSGPYTIHEEDIDMGKTITMRRRDDWWGQGNPAWQGLYNIGSYKWEVVRDYNLEYEKVKAGELDFLVITRAQWFAKDLLEVDAVQRGLLVRNKIFNDAPKGTSGMAINTQRPPLDDRRVRLALNHLYNRELLIEKHMYKEYERLKSHWPGGAYENRNNEMIDYDPFRAVELLEEAGWTEEDSDGIRVKDGKRLEFTIDYNSQGLEKYYTVYQENCKKAGIAIDLNFMTSTARWKNMREKKFDLSSTAWGALIIANPESSWHSQYADKVDTNNVTSFADPRVDELCKQYDEEYDPAKRIELVKQIDAIVSAAHPYVMGWYLPCERSIFWNKFGMPEWGTTRCWDDKNMHFCWWIDPEKEAELERAKADKSLTMDPGPVENYFWRAWHQNHDQ